MKTNFFNKSTAVKLSALLLGLFGLFIIVITIIGQPILGVGLASVSLLAYPLPGDNARRRAHPLYDNGTFATGTTEYSLFQNTSTSKYNRNRTLPLSGSEVFFINGIQLWLGLPAALQYSFALFQFLRESYLSIQVGESKKLQIPLWEIANFNYGEIIGATTTELIAEKTFKRQRLLQKPIIINANTNAQIKIVTTAAGATAMNTATFKLYLNGIKYDKLYDFEYDAWKGQKFEELSYSLYDVVTLATTEETLDIFATKNKAETLNNKVFPLAKNESFQVEAIEILGVGTETTGNLQAVLNELRDMYLEISVGDTKILESTALDMFSAGCGAAGSFQDAGTVATVITQVALHKSVYVLPIPIVLPETQNIKVQLMHGALSYCKGNLLVDFRGTLSRSAA